MAMIFDSHAHYDDAAFDADRQEVLKSLPAHGVEGVINCATDAKSAEWGVRTAAQIPHLWCMVGIHPEQAGEATEEDWRACEALLSSPKVVGIGEIGLDYHYSDSPPREVQKYWFEKQLDAAVRYGLPVSVHDRDGHEDTLSLLRRHRPQGVIHCFSGSVEMAREVVRMGLYIGIGGVVTFRNARKAVEVVRDMPLDRLLLETDAPYMAPVPYRGKRCDSSMIEKTAGVIAEIRGITTQQVYAQNRANVKALFGI